MQTISPFTISEMDRLADAIRQQVLNCDAQIEAGSKYGYDLEAIRRHQTELMELMDKIYDHQKRLPD